MRYIKHLFSGLLIAMTVLLSSCTYDEGVSITAVTVRTSEPIADAEVIMSSTLGAVFSAPLEADGTAHLDLPPGIYSASVSKSVDDGYVRTVVNGSRSDIVVSGATTDIYLDLTVSTIVINNPLLIKEIYVGGCQKDDGSGKFAIDKAIILYNNSSSPASLDNVAFGIVEPYNAEATLHSFLSNGILEYADEDWVPAINGIWYFQPGHTIAPYSELVVNVYGCIDNTLTYSNSVNYANPDYFTMYDVEATSSDGGKYNNTNYYPSPSELIPTSHYLKAVKYGQSNAWPISMFSPALILFRTQDTTPSDFGNDQSNIIYPADKQGNLIYACLKVPREWIVDAVEVFNAEKISTSHKRMTPDLDNGYVQVTSGYGHSVVRKIEKIVDGHKIYQDTNNSSNDFEETLSFSIR